MLDGSRFSALVVGGGGVALRKVRALLDGGVRVTVVAQELAGDLRELASTDPRLTLLQGKYEAACIGDCTIVIAATNDAAVNLLVARDGLRLGRLVNNVSEPDAGNVVMPAVHRAGDLTIAVSAGRLPGAATAIRDAIAERFDSRYAAAIADLRELRARLLGQGDGDAWQAISADVLGDEFCAKVESHALESTG